MKDGSVAMRTIEHMFMMTLLSGLRMRDKDLRAKDLREDEIPECDNEQSTNTTKNAHYEVYL